MNKRQVVYLLTAVIALSGTLFSCQKHTYDFTHSPNNPKAGQKVSFVNQSDAGENWVWSFGDGGKSTQKSPTHIFTEAGTYAVELMVDSNKSRRITHMLEVLDSIPSIYLASDTVRQYAPLTFKASFYNPSKATVSYLWDIEQPLFVITQGDLTSDSIVGYFTDYGRTTDISLILTIGSKTTESSRTITLIDNPAPALTMQTLEGRIWWQRIYEGIYEIAKPYRGAEDVINPANDSTAVLNGVTYDIHDMPVLTGIDVHALQVDPINRKLYLILDDGLYVANANGDALTQITDDEALTLLIDNERNSIYWSTDLGVLSMPLVTNPQNIIGEQLLGKIVIVNDVPNVTRMLIRD